MSSLVLLAGMNCTADLWADAGLDGAIQPALDSPTQPPPVEALLGELPERLVLVGH